MNATQRGVDAPPASRLNGEAVERIAQQKGWTTDDQIAHGLGLGSRASFYRYVNGTQDPRLARARYAAEQAGMSLDELWLPGQAA